MNAGHIYNISMQWKLQLHKTKKQLMRKQNAYVELLI